MPAPATHQARSPALQDRLPLSNAAPPTTAPLSANKQPAAHDTFATDAHPGASTPARAEDSLETQEHTAEACENKSVAELASSAAPQGSDMLETSPACSPKSIQSPPSPHDQHAAPAQLCTSTPFPHSTHQTIAASSLPAPGSDPPQSISTIVPSAPQVFPTAGAPMLAGVQQATAPVDTSRQPVNDQAAAARPQLSVQEYSLPEARNAEFLQEAQVHAEPADLASLPTASAGHSRSHSSQMEDNAVVEALLTESPLAGTIAGPAGRAASRRWGHQLTQAEPELQKVEVTVQAQTDQHASARQALPPTMHLHQQELVVHSPQKPNMLRLQPQPISVASAQAPMSTPAEVAVQNAAQASQSNAAPASGNQDPDVPHCEAPHAQSPIPHDQEMLEAAVKQTGLELASHMEAANSAVPTVLAECLASNRIKRVPGGDPLEAAPFRRFVEMVRSNSHDFEAQGRVLRLKQYISADVRPAAINAILEALAVNTLVEVLYIQNFEQGMFDEQLLRLTEVLKKGRIWALNAGENFEISMQAWEKFTKELQHTAVAYMYVSEHHLARTDLKRRMQDAIRDNRRQAPRRDADVIKCVGNMWWNPKLPLDMRSAASRPTGGESALASLARDMAASQAGSRHSGSDSQSRKHKQQPQDTAVSSQGGLHAAPNGKTAQKAAKRQRQAASAVIDSPQTTGSAAESQPELTPAEKREMRIKRREQRRVPEAGPVAAQTRPSQDACRAAASSPAASHSRAPASAPAGHRAPGPRSRLAEQSGPSMNALADSDDADEAAVIAAAAMTDPEAQDSLSAGAAEEMRDVPTGSKRKRSQLQPRQPAVAVARSVRLANSTAAGQQLEPDAMTEQSRSSEAATPVGPRRRRGPARKQSFPPAARQVQEEQEEQEAECEQNQPVRRTGRQRKLTAAAVAAVEDFPSLYKQPAQPPASVTKAKVARDTSESDASSEDWPEEEAIVQMSQLVQYGVLPAGRHEFLFKNSRTCEVEVFPDGEILYLGELYDSLARLGKALLEESSTGRQSCNCWRDITWQGDKMETFRQAAYNKYLQAKKFQRKFGMIFVLQVMPWVKDGTKLQARRSLFRKAVFQLTKI
ncbi:hypothetical protein WJX82_001305 [Trebouxia sp. C0006]